MRVDLIGRVSFFMPKFYSNSNTCTPEGLFFIYRISFHFPRFTRSSTLKTRRVSTNSPGSHRDFWLGGSKGGKKVWQHFVWWVTVSKEDNKKRKKKIKIRTTTIDESRSTDDYLYVWNNFFYINWKNFKYEYFLVIFNFYANLS